MVDYILGVKAPVCWHSEVILFISFFVLHPHCLSKLNIIDLITAEYGEEPTPL